MPIEVRETTIVPGELTDVVQLHISDVAPDAEGATFRLVLHATLPAFQAPLVAQLQREAMKIAQDALTPLLQKLAREITDAKYSLEPHRKPTPKVHYGGSTEGPDDN